MEIQIQELKKKIWSEHKLSTSVFYNQQIDINSKDVRGSENLKELKAIAEYLNVHIKELIEMSSEISSEIKLKRHNTYIFTQRCLKSQADWSVFKLKTKQI